MSVPARAFAEGANESHILGIRGTKETNERNAEDNILKRATSSERKVWKRATTQQ